MSGESVVAWAIRISVREPGVSSSLVLGDIGGAARLAAAARPPAGDGLAAAGIERVLPGLDRLRRQAAGAADYRRAQMCLQCGAGRSILR